MAITLRADKGSELTHTEMDVNFSDLRDGVDLQVPKTQGTGLKIDSLGTPDFGWHDLNGVGDIIGLGNDPSMSIYRDTLPEFQFTENNEALFRFHLPHDYAMGTDIFIHVHWSHNSLIVTGGSCTWAFESTYAKGHNQDTFGATGVVSIVQSASTIQYQHMIAETAMSVSGGSATQFDTDNLEVDGVILTRMYLDSNDLTSSGAVPNPFVHFVDIHYQSTGVPTKQRAPDFWT